MLNAVNAIFIS